MLHCRASDSASFTLICEEKDQVAIYSINTFWGVENRLLSCTTFAKHPDQIDKVSLRADPWILGSVSFIALIVGLTIGRAGWIRRN